VSKDAIAEFMAHLIIADNHIHADQIAILRDFIDTYSLHESQKTIFSVLEGKGESHYSELLQKLKGLNEEDKNILIQNSAAIVGFDCHFASEEKLAVRRLCKETGIDPELMKSAIAEIIKQARKARDERVNVTTEVDSFDALSLKIRRFFSSGARREYLSSKIRENELTGPEYAEAVRKTNAIAEVDCRLVESQLDLCVDALKKAREQLHHNLQHSNKIDEKSTEEQVGFFEFMKSMTANLDRQADSAMKEIKNVVEKKRRAKGAFTIALMGRTKAGKSTLHYVMTGEGADFIGVGSERTTRYNRVYEWENLRVIDTPGIGAAEAGGRDDEEIALSVVDTADVICYVVTNDSVQEVEFKFLSKIRDSNKPIFILLNCKDNLRSPPPKLKRFIRDPLHWYSRSDEQNLDGIVNRIKRGVAQYYEGGYVTIIPVHLLAAKMAGEEQYKSSRDALNAGSRMNEFFNEIRENVIELGQLRKSQTLLDGTVVRLSEMLKEVESKRNASVVAADEIDTRKAALIAKVVARSEKNKSACLSRIDLLINQERSGAIDFATENYKSSKKQIEAYWEKESGRIELDIKSSLDAALKQTAEEVNSYVQDAVDDVALTANVASGANFGSYSTFNTRRLVSILGALLSTGAGLAMAASLISNPIGWAILGAGAVIGALSGFMDSKEDKQRKAVAHMKEQVDKSLSALKDGYVQLSEKVFTDYTVKLSSEIDSALGKVALQYRRSGEVLLPYIESLDKAIEELNVQFAIRIIEFARNERVLDHLDAASKPSVSRVPGQVISILTGINVPESGIERARCAIREDIVFEK
jgi:GTP-binding protein EngB required for normal cell division